MDTREKVRCLSRISLLALAYFAAGKLGLRLAFLNASATAVWPPSGIALAALVLGGPALWPGVFIGAFLVNLTTAGTWATALAIAAGNTLEAAAGCWLVARYCGGGRAFERPQRTLAFLLLAGAASPMLAATIGVSSLFAAGYSQGASFQAVWLTWWLGDLAGIVVAAPLLIAWRRRSGVIWDWARAREAALLAAVLVLACGALFAGGLPWSGRNDPSAFVFFPIMAWACFRFGPRETAACSLVLAGSAVLGTVRGHGPFVRQSPHESLLILQFFMAAVCGPSLVFASASALLRRTEVSLKRSRRFLTRALRARTGELTRSEGRYRPLFESNLIGIFETDGAGRVLSGNEEFLRLTGYSHEELAAGLRREPVPFGPPRECQYLRKDGSFLAVLAGAVPIAGTREHAIGFLIDDTARQRADAVMRERAEDLSRSNAELAQFAAIASHDLQAPLHKIHAFGERLQAKISAQGDPEADDYLRRIMRAADRMGALIRDVLSLARVTSRGQTLRPVELDAVAREVAADLEAAVMESGARLEIGPLPVVTADPTQMRQLLQNLIGNALKFRKPAAAPVIKVGGRDHGDGFAELFVEDNGIGFDPRFQDRLFQPFSRLNSAQLYDGSGMGLAICRRIALRHGGSVAASGRLGEGARFSVVLPAAGGRAAPAERPEAVSHG